MQKSNNRSANPFTSVNSACGMGPVSCSTPPNSIGPDQCVFSVNGEQKSFSKYGAIRKWSPVIENVLPRMKNYKIKEALSCFCEWFSMKESEFKSDVNELPLKVNQIAKKIKNWSERIEVIGKYFNPVSGEIEYKLSNGNYVPINSEFEYEISNDDMEELFGCEFIRDFDICAFRDSQIDKII